ncbi:mitochondrial import receptor subunit Tom22 [Lithohypha guttulata]|uniref:Mitochondrial import receptor subunit Tom22 n=1 Tax=Lithohypha guttulata TaxID=1690604 RepID=A0AAN7T0Z7_9EURO|nr:mitochondrial import receptor subunit Tom22 [Lithohypha guttulata]KAK5085795.1 mitochondrial import receptor subunit Tom22 [Lithohypha guttulata]KAK5103323.1 mitochondrial import receptor subunit Tom22 [Lithohypha guttulata]
MVRLEEVEDETFVDKPVSSSGDALLMDDDADYTDTDSEISDASDLDSTPYEESIYDRITALKDIVSPTTRARLSSAFSTTYNATSKSLTFGGKGLWIITTSVLLLGLPYALALQDEQMVQEEERQRQLMTEGQSGLMNAGGEAKPAL